MVHGGEGLELLANGLIGPTLFGQARVLVASRGDHLCLELGQRLGDLLADLGANTRGAEEVAIEDAARIMVELDDGADDTTTFELPPSAADDAKEEEEEYDVLESKRARNSSG